MLNFRPVLLVTGALVAALGVTMLIPMAADLLATAAVHRADWSAFAIGAAASILIGGGAAAASWGRIETISLREGFLLTSASWLVLVVFSAIPLALGEMRLSYIDAFFEAMSGITTTGSTVVTGLDVGLKAISFTAFSLAILCFTLPFVGDNTWYMLNAIVQGLGCESTTLPHPSPFPTSQHPPLLPQP